VQEAIGDYAKACELAPTSGIAAADLGFAYFFSGDFQHATIQFNQALKLDSGIAFLTPWRYAAASRMNQDLSQDPAVLHAASTLPEKRNWFDWLTLFQMGKVTESELLAAANPSDIPTRNAQLCEAYYFIGFEMLRRKQPEDARAFFEQAMSTDAERLSAFRGARIALMAIDGMTASK
jgi:tetratricopeptide (TPR) repeat protein